MEDNTLLAEELGRLQEELKNEKRKAQSYQQEIGKLKWDLKWQNVSYNALGIFIALLVAGGFCVLAYLLSHEKVTGRCYVQHSTYQISGYGVYQEIDWAADNRIGFFLTAQEATNFLASQKCETK